MSEIKWGKWDKFVLGGGGPALSVVGPEKPPKKSPLEVSEQRLLSAWLDAVGLLWFHPPNESVGGVVYRMNRKRNGVKSGAPDFLIFNPTKCGQHRGVAIEMKRANATSSAVSVNQRQWLRALREQGWHTVVALGFAPARNLLTELYGANRPRVVK